MKKEVLGLFFLLMLGLFSASVYSQEEIVSDSNSNEIIGEQDVSNNLDEDGISDRTFDEGSVDKPEEESSGSVASQEILNKVEEEVGDVVLEVSPGITPDSPVYFVEDVVLSRFRDDLSNREKKIAEVRAMVEEGNMDAAKESLVRYERYAGNLEQEIPPEKREEARRSAIAIKKTMDEIEEQIPEDSRKEFVENVLDTEGKIVTAVEIASKIKELCETLSKMDPLAYSRVCKIEGDVPDWRKNLDKKLTDEQRKEAEKFGRIMEECFKTSGQECKCEEIPFSDFAETCKIASPLATACEINKDETACEQLDDLEMPELPEHLQDVFDRLEGNIRESQFDVHLPTECREEGAQGTNACIELMFRRNAPGPCLNALDRGEISFTNEREAREACDKIMFEENAPEECVEAGAQDPKECGKIMFQLNAPQECIDAGLTGENKGDDKKCREIMRGKEFKHESRVQCSPGEHPGINDLGQSSCIRGQSFGGANCRSISDQMERLKCYDSAAQGVGERVERGEMERKEVREYRQIEGQKCPDNVCDEFERTHAYACPEDCGGVRESFEGEVRPPQEFQPPEGFHPSEGEFQQPPIEQQPAPSSETTITTEGSGTTTSGESSPSTTTESSGTSGGEPAPTGAIILNNEFFNYYYR